MCDMSKTKFLSYKLSDSPGLPSKCMASFFPVEVSSERPACHERPITQEILFCQQLVTSFQVEAQQHKHPPRFRLGLQIETCVSETDYHACWGENLQWWSLTWVTHKKMYTEYEDTFECEQKYQPIADISVLTCMFLIFAGIQTFFKTGKNAWTTDWKWCNYVVCPAGPSVNQ